MPKFNGGEVVVVPLPVAPEMVLWALPGPQGVVGPVGPKGDKGDKGDPGLKGDRGDDGDVSQAKLDAAVATLIDGAPASYSTLGKLVTALQNHELGGSTDASLLTGALTDQVEAADARVSGEMWIPWEEENGPFSASLAEIAESAIHAQYMVDAGLPAWIYSVLDDKSDVGHTHDGADLSGEVTESLNLSNGVFKLSAYDPETGQELPDEALIMPLAEFASYMYMYLMSGLAGILIGDSIVPWTEDGGSGSAAPLHYALESIVTQLAAKSDVGHTHPVTDLATLDPVTSKTGRQVLTCDSGYAEWKQLEGASSLLNFDSSQVEQAISGTTFGIALRARALSHGQITNPASTVVGPVSGQMVRYAADAAISAREWTGTQAQFDALGAKNPNTTYYIVD